MLVLGKRFAVFGIERTLITYSGPAVSVVGEVVGGVDFDCDSGVDEFAAVPGVLASVDVDGVAVFEALEDGPHWW